MLFSKARSERDLYYKAIETVNCIFEQIKHCAPKFAKVAPEHAWQHPKNTAAILADGKKIGTLCALHPQNAAKLDKTGSAVCIEIDIDDFSNVKAYDIAFKEPSSRQSTYYDLSLVLKNGVTFDELSECWKSLSINELESVKLIDTYELLGTKSITLRFTFSSHARTLEMDEVQSWINEILRRLAAIGVTLRV